MLSACRLSQTLGLMTSPSHPVIPEGDRQSLAILYQVTAADIAFFKQQQWSIMNYAIGLDGALVIVSQHPATKPLTTLVAWALVVLVCAIPAVGAMVLQRLRTSIEARRNRLKQTRELLGPLFLRAWEVKKEADDFYFVFVGILVSSWLVTLWLVWPSA